MALLDTKHLTALLTGCFPLKCDCVRVQEKDQSNQWSTATKMVAIPITQLISPPSNARADVNASTDG